MHPYKVGELVWWLGQKFQYQSCRNRNEWPLKLNSSESVGKLIGCKWIRATVKFTITVHLKILNRILKNIFCTIVSRNNKRMLTIPRIVPTATLTIGYLNALHFDPSCRFGKTLSLRVAILGKLTFAQTCSNLVYTIKLFLTWEFCTQERKMSKQTISY